jgi:hypothetical protein
VASQRGSPQAGTTLGRPTGPLGPGLGSWEARPGARPSLGPLARLTGTPARRPGRATTAPPHGAANLACRAVKGSHRRRPQGPSLRRRRHDPHHRSKGRGVLPEPSQQSSLASPPPSMGGGATASRATGGVGRLRFPTYVLDHASAPTAAATKSEPKRLPPPRRRGRTSRGRVRRPRQHACGKAAA